MLNGINYNYKLSVQLFGKTAKSCAMRHPYKLSCDEFVKFPPTSETTSFPPFISQFKIFNKYLQPSAKRAAKVVDSKSEKVMQHPKLTGHFVRGCHHYPRYIYHMTSLGNYREILTSGKLRCPFDDKFTGRSIFAVDLENLFNFWGSVKTNKGEFYIKTLLRQVSKGTPNIVILRIPTSKLKNLEALRMRTQKGIVDGTQLIGVPAKLRKQFHEPIEYYYPDEIPIDCFDKIGEVNLNELGTNPSMRDIFMHLLQGTPEYEAAKKLLKC